MRTSRSTHVLRNGCLAAAGAVLAALWIGVLICAPTAQATVIANINPIPAPANGCYVGAYVGTDATELATFDQQAGKRHAFFLKFIDVNGGDPSDSWPSVEQFCQSCYAVGALPEVTLQPNHATSASLLTTEDAAWMEGFSENVGQLGRPVFIRFGHEMNGDWYRWGWGHVSPDVYIQGFRQVADDFRANAPQVAMVWAPSQNWGGDTDPVYSNWYPGDAYVDWVGLTTYQWPYSGIDTYQFADSILYGTGSEGNFYDTFAVGHDKPMMIAETACGDDDPAYYDNLWVGGSQDETGTYGTGVGQGAQNWWIRQVYKTGTDWSATNVLFPRIHAICWFAQDDFDFGGTDLAAHSTGISTYAQAISDPYWLSYVTPPVTRIEGLVSGWTDHDVTLSLVASDPASPEGISTYFGLNGGDPVAYDSPVTLSAEGTTPIVYYSVDASGNAEAEQTATVLIDKTWPTTADDHVPTYSVSATVTLSATDSLSGVAGTSWSLDGVAGTGTVVATKTIGHHILTYSSWDVAGNHEPLHTSSFYVVPLQLLPTISRWPSRSSLTYKRRKGQAKFMLSVALTDARGAVAGRYVWLQRSAGGKKWSNLYKLETNGSGKASKAFSVKKNGTTYYRWLVPATAFDRTCLTGKQKVVVK